MNLVRMTYAGTRNLKTVSSFILWCQRLSSV